jgi:hypothetical protein
VAQPIAVLAPLPLFEIGEEAVDLAKDLIRIGLLPERAEVDALHSANQNDLSL